MNADLFLLRAVNGLAGRYESLDKAAVFVAGYLEYFLVAVLVFILIKGAISKNIRSIRTAVLGAVSAPFALFVVKYAISLSYYRPRPFLVDGNVHEILHLGSDRMVSAFPSGHTIFFFAMASVVYLNDRKLGRWFYVGAVLIGLARVFVGVHWPSDVLAGAILGILTGWGINRLATVKQKP